MTNISNHAAAAKMIRAELKKNNVSARVRARSYAGGSSVTVELSDAAPWTVKAIERFAFRFQYGHFDGMTDSYEYSNRNADLPQVKFIFVENNISDELRQAAYNYLRETWGGYENHPAGYSDAMNLRGNTEWVSDEVHRVLSGRMGSFWQKPRVRCAA